MFIRDDGTPGTYEENVSFYTNLINYQIEQLNFSVSEFDKYLKTQNEESIAQRLLAFLTAEIDPETYKELIEKGKVRIKNAGGSLTYPQELEENRND